MLGQFFRLEILTGILAFIGIVTVPLDWVPVISSGGTVLEVPNMVSLLFAMILPFVLLMSKRMWRINLIFGLMLLWTLVFVLAMILHQTPEGLPAARQQVMQCLFGWTLALSIAHSNIRVSRIGFWALVSLGSILLISSVIVGVSLFDETLHFMLTLDRDRFAYKALRPTFNAFVSNNSDADYVASMINNVANGIALFAALVFFPDRKEPRGLFAPEKLFAFAFIGFAFIMFSSSATLVILTFLTILGLHLMTHSSMLVRSTLPLLGLAAMIAVTGPVLHFVEGNLESDAKSRGGRVGQYEVAIDRISESVVSGTGYFQVDGLPVHNWALFSWSAAGYLPFLIVISVYVGLALSGFQALKLLRNSSIVIIPLMAQFYIRTSVGGGGGVPAGCAVVAIAVIMGLLERYHRVERQKSAMPESDPRPVQAIGWDRDRPAMI